MNRQDNLLETAASLEPEYFRPFIARMSKSLGDELYMRRSQLGVGRNTLAREAGVSDVTIQNVEFAENWPRRSTLVKILEALRGLEKKLADSIEVSGMRIEKQVAGVLITGDTRKEIVR